MSCERTSKRVAKLAATQMHSKKVNQRSVAALALRARRRSSGR